MSDLPELRQQKVPQSDFDPGQHRKPMDAEMPKPKKTKSDDDKGDVQVQKPHKDEDDNEKKNASDKKEEEKKDQPAQKGSSCCLLI